MNKKPSLILILLLFSLIGCISNSGDDNTLKFRIPAQWEAHEAIWFGWEENSKHYHPIVADMMQALQGNVNIKVAVKNDSISQLAKQTLDSLGVDTSAIEMHPINNQLHWIRDNGAIFGIDSTQNLAVVDFEWGNYGYIDWYVERNEISDDELEQWKNYSVSSPTAKVDSLMGVATKANYLKSTIAIEGGGFEYNGNGVLIQCEAVTLQRNPGKTKKDIELEYKKLGIEKVIWLPKGLVEDEHIFQYQNGGYVVGGTGGHTDEFVRFVDENTILLAWVFEDEIEEHPLNRINYERMLENYKILKTSTAINGKPFDIIKVPLPRPIEKKVVVKDENDSSTPYTITAFLPKDNISVGDTLISIAASSYLNYLVTNGVILMGKYKDYGSADKDEQVRQIFEKIYPDREIIMLDVLPLNEDGGGGIHCSTIQEPKVSKKTKDLRREIGDKMLVFNFLCFQFLWFNFIVALKTGLI